MPTGIFVLYCISVIAALLAAIAGMYFFKKTPHTLQIIAILLVLTAISESFSLTLTIFKKWEARYLDYHIFNVLQAILFSIYFIRATFRYYQNALIIAATIFWSAIGLLNMAFLQPPFTLNNNMLMIESFMFITLSLYLIYHRLKIDKEGAIIRDPHFRIAFLTLVLWGSSFFFWAFVKVLYEGQWQYIRIAVYIQMCINISFYAGTAMVLVRLAKKNHQI